jgi:HCNGP-like protein
MAELPPLNTNASAEVTARFAKYWESTQQGSSLVASLRAKKAFRNPYLLEETISTFGIDETGSAFPKHLFDPLGLPTSDYYDVLNIRQQIESDARAARQAARKEVEFLPAGGAAAPASGELTSKVPSSSSTSSAPAKKSRFA